jgi:predicted dehydrogenase
MIVSVFGLGSIGRRHLSNLLLLKKELNITELRGFDINPQKKFLKPFLNKVSISDNLENIASDTDVAFVCSPTHLHIKSLRNILKFCKPHIYLEKPFSHTLSDCKNISKIIKTNNKKLHVGYMMINHPITLMAKNYLKKIGRVLFARAEAGFYLPSWHPWERYQDFYMSKIEQGGGALLDISHEINLLQFLFGKVKSVSGSSIKTVSDLELSSDDLTLSTLQFENFSAQIQLDLLQFEEARFFKIIGTKGSIEVNFVKNTINYYNLKSKKWTRKKINFNFDKIYLIQLRYFFNSIYKNKKVNLSNPEDAIHTMEIINAMRISSKNNGRKVKI